MTYLFSHRKIGFWGILFIAAGVAFDSALGATGIVLAVVGVLLVVTYLYQWEDEEDG